LSAADFLRRGLFLSNRSGQRLIVDPDAKIVTLRKSKSEAVLHWLIRRVAIADRIRHGKTVPEWNLKAEPRRKLF